MAKPINPLEELLDELRDRALDWVEDILEGSTERLKATARTITPPHSPRPPQGRKKRVQGASTGQRQAARPAPPSKPIRTAYTVLGVTPDAEPEVLAAAYRAMSRKYHPDLHPGDKKAENRMLELNAAWEILKDPKMKAEYDRRMGL